jgi:hypothetical protein
VKDFGRWFQEQTLPPTPTTSTTSTPSVDELLEEMGLDLMKDGSVWGNCLVCGSGIRLTDYMSTEEVLMNVDPENLHCGRSPRCCP